VGYHFTTTNHAWIAVKLDHTWHLFDATWGAGSVDGGKFIK
jgi:transglutaminase/protease-like cytokinesis protein 3